VNRIILLVLAFFVFQSLLIFGAEPYPTKYWGSVGGADINNYSLKNIHGIRVSLIDFGATIQSLFVPDRNGVFEDIVLGYTELDGYISDTSYYGCTVGRYANRIGSGNFAVDGIVYTLPKNDGTNTLHGGINGFNKKKWTSMNVFSEEGEAVRMTYTSPDGEEGFPGTLRVSVTFILTDENELIIEYEANTDRKTVLNLTNHSYFNLMGEGNGDILNHVLQVFSDRAVEIDSRLIPTGRFIPVDGTPLDFRAPRTVGLSINEACISLQLAKGYDHTFVLDKRSSEELTYAARLYEPSKGRVLEVWTTEPGVHVYTGNFLNGGTGKNGKTYPYRSAICLETQHFADSPNRLEFPTTVLEPGETFRSRTVYKFSVSP
jgi:aldose 1-epimerase